MTDFNRIAPFYDFLKRIIFQSNLDKASSFFISQLPLNSTILIVGGGTGKLLGEFHESQTIVYVEHAAYMLKKAQERSYSAQVHFIHADIKEAKLKQEFDVIITPFILDCFYPEDLKFIFNNLKLQLKPQGYWLQTDFYPHGKVQNSLVQIMYFFFKITAGLELSEIPDFDQLFNNKEFIEKKNVRFKRGLIQSKYYQKIA